MEKQLIIRQLENKLIEDKKLKYFVNIMSVVKYKFTEKNTSFVACADSRKREITFTTDFFNKTENEQLNIFFEELLHIFLVHSHRIDEYKTRPDFNLELFKLACEIERQQIQEELQFVDLNDTTEAQIYQIRKELSQQYDISRLSAEQIYLILQNIKPQGGGAGSDIGDGELEGEAAELTAINKELIQAAADSVIKSISKNGSLPGSLSAYQEFVAKLKRKKSIKNILSQIILRQNVRLYDFRKINKRSEEILLPGFRKEKRDQVLVIFDVSGSMSNYIDDAYTYVNEIARTFRNTRCVIADVDAIAEIDPKKQMHKLQGMGGTQLDVAYRNCHKNENIVIFVTDADTDFPSKDELKNKQCYCISVTKKAAPKHIRTFHV